MNRVLGIGMLVLLGLLVHGAEAQAVCGSGTAAACDPSSAAVWVAPATNLDGTPLTDLGGYDVLSCPTAPCTRSTAGVVIKNVGKPSAACVNGLGETLSPPCVLLSSLVLGANGTKNIAVDAFDTSGNASAPTATLTFIYSSTIPDRVPPSAPVLLRVQ